MQACFTEFFDDFRNFALLPRHGFVSLFFGRPIFFGMTKKKLVLPNRKIEKPKIQEKFIFCFFTNFFLVIPFFSFFVKENIGFDCYKHLFDYI